MGSEATLMWILVAMWQVMIGQNRLRASGPHIWVPFGWMGFVQRTGRICVWGLLSPCDISNSTPWAILIAWFIIQFLTALTGSFEWGVYGQINNFTQHALSPWDWSCVIYLNKEIFPLACLWRWKFFYFCSKALIFPTLFLYWGKWQNYPYIFFSWPTFIFFYFFFPSLYNFFFPPPLPNIWSFYLVIQPLVIISYVCHACGPLVEERWVRWASTWIERAGKTHRARLVIKS